MADQKSFEVQKGLGENTRRGIGLLICLICLIFLIFFDFFLICFRIFDFFDIFLICFGIFDLCLLLRVFL